MFPCYKQFIIDGQRDALARKGTRMSTKRDALIVTPTGTEALATTMAPDSLGIMNAEQFGQEFATAKGYTVEATVSLKKGEAIKGILVGRGPDMETGDEKLVNPVTGEMARDKMQTWVLLVGNKVEEREAPKLPLLVRRGGVQVRLIGKHNINQFLAGVIPGEEVGIYFADKDSIGAKQVNKYICTHRILATE